jgi:hypothetical protein
MHPISVQTIFRPGYGEDTGGSVTRCVGDTDEEIAARLGYVTRTVERMLARIRGIWADELKG